MRVGLLMLVLLVRMRLLLLGCRSWHHKSRRSRRTMCRHRRASQSTRARILRVGLLVLVVSRMLLMLMLMLVRVLRWFRPRHSKPG